jgi:hypothetical protein
MDPTRHIMKKKNSELAIFCSWKNKWTQLATLPMQKQILNWPYFILEKKNGPKSSHHEEKISGLVIFFFWKEKKKKRTPKLSHYEDLFF